MRLKNNKGIERNFEVLFEVLKKDDRYIIYRDSFTKNIYCGKKDENKLIALNDKEYKKIESILKKVVG